MPPSSRVFLQIQRLQLAGSLSTVFAVNLILYVWQRHRPTTAQPTHKMYLILWRRSRLSTEGKIVSKYCNISKTQGGPSTPPPPLPLLYHGGMTLRVRPRINEYSSTSESNGRHLIPQLKTRGGAKRF